MVFPHYQITHITDCTQNKYPPPAAAQSCVLEYNTSVTSPHTRQTCLSISSPPVVKQRPPMSEPGFRVRRQIGRAGGAADPNNLARCFRRFQTAEESAHFPPNRASAPPVYYRFVTRAKPPPSKGGGCGGEGCCKKQGSVQ